MTYKAAAGFGARRYFTLAVTLAALALPLAAVPAAHAARSLSQRAVLSARVRHVRVGGVSFAYRSIGSGRPLLLPSNLQARMSNWDPAVLARVAARHRVIIYDHRGVGLSKGDVSHMTMAQLADDAARVIRKLRLGRPDVWGQRMGGSVAELLAIRHPTRVRRLVLTAALAGGGHYVGGGAPWFTDFTPDAAGRARRGPTRRGPRVGVRRRRSRPLRAAPSSPRRRGTSSCPLRARGGDFPGFAPACLSPVGVATSSPLPGTRASSRPGCATRPFASTPLDTASTSRTAPGSSLTCCAFSAKGDARRHQHRRLRRRVRDRRRQQLRDTRGRAVAPERPSLPGVG
jgi:pimeloyl-ACP methyl ester carboxylesterase